MSVRLFHGPSAEKSALQYASTIGQAVLPPVGKEGLKVAEAREVVEALMTPPLGDRAGTVVIGPLDKGNPKALDALLKCVEDYQREVGVPVLWADDLGVISGTLRSRCIPVYCPGKPSEASEALEDLAREAVTVALSKSPWRLPGLFTRLSSDDLTVLVGLISDQLLIPPMTPEKVGLWTRFRRVAEVRNPSPVEVVAWLLP